jgi:hypothetical protein
MKRQIENHPAAYVEVVTAVQEIPRPKPLPTPASTPCHTDLHGEQASAPLPPQHITQEEELDPDDQTDQQENLFVELHDHGSPAVQQELNQRSRPLYHAYVEDATTPRPSRRAAILSVRRTSTLELSTIYYYNSL